MFCADPTTFKPHPCYILLCSTLFDSTLFSLYPYSLLLAPRSTSTPIPHFCCADLLCSTSIPILLLLNLYLYLYSTSTLLYSTLL